MSLEKKLQELLDALPEYRTTIPDELTHYEMRRNGSECRDLPTLRLVSLATQKFMSEVLEEAHNIYKTRREALVTHQKAEGFSKEKRVVLTTEDLTDALNRVGIRTSAAPYYSNNINEPGTS